MESFFIAETLKYLYMVFDGGCGAGCLVDHVFNTEAHPFPPSGSMPLISAAPLRMEGRAEAAR